MTTRHRALAIACVSALVAGVLGWQWVQRSATEPAKPDPVRAFLAPWYDAVAAHDEAAATVVVVGDSISEGSMSGVDVLTQRWQAVLQRQLRDEVGAEGATGFVPPYWGDAMSTEVTLLGGVPAQEKRFGPWGLGGRALMMPGGSTITYPALPADRVRVGFGLTDFVGGQGRVFVDDVDVTALGEVNQATSEATPLVTISGAGQVPRAGLWWTSPALGPGPHTVRVESTVPGFQFVHTGVEFVDGADDTGVHVLDASQAGATAADFASEEALAGTWTEVAARDADLVLVNLGSNPSPDFEDELGVVVDRALAASPDTLVLVVDGYEPGTWSHEEWQKVRDARRRVVAGHDERVALFDLAAQWPLLAKDGSTSEGLMAEVPPLHLTPQGQQRMGDVFTDLLSP